MMRNHAFVPRPILRSAGMHRYRPGQTVQGIAGLYGQPPSSYRDLVAVNHHKPLNLHGVAGTSATFLSLQEGEQLRLPWFWFAGKHAAAQKLILGGMVGDVQQDVIASAIMGMLAPLATTNEAKLGLPTMVNMLGLLWRQDHPNGEVPASVQDLVAYSNSATSWWDTIGVHLPQSVAASIPWTEVPFRAWAIFQGASGLNPGTINWAVVNDYLEKNVDAGMFPATYTPIDFKQSIDFGQTVPNTNGAWVNQPWGVMSQVRWDLLPISYLDTSGLPANQNLHTDWLLGKIKDAVAKKTTAQGGPLVEETPPGDVAMWPSITPPDCAKNGPTFYPERNAQGLYTGACLGCGKNAMVAPDGLCDCMPGFQTDPLNPNSPDCVKVGGAQSKSPVAAKEDDSSTTALLIVGGVVVGGLALYFANRKK